MPDEFAYLVSPFIYVFCFSGKSQGKAKSQGAAFPHPHPNGAGFLARNPPLSEFGRQVIYQENAFDTGLGVHTIDARLIVEP